MNFSHLRSQLAQLRASMPAIESNTGGPARNARRLEVIAREPKGPRRRFAIYFAVSTARNEEPADFAALLDAIGPEAIALAFPDGPPQPHGDPQLRARARAWKEPAGSVDPISAMLHVQIARVQT